MGSYKWFAGDLLPFQRRGCSQEESLLVAPARRFVWSEQQSKWSSTGLTRMLKTKYTFFCLASRIFKGSGQLFYSQDISVIHCFAPRSRDRAVDTGIQWRAEPCAADVVVIIIQAGETWMNRDPTKEGGQDGVYINIYQWHSQNHIGNRFHVLSLNVGLDINSLDRQTVTSKLFKLWTCEIPWEFGSELAASPKTRAARM